jgi:outer membrane lipoprotein SlyB
MQITDKWMPRLILAAQVAVVCVMGALVGLGKDGVITDALLAVSGSIAGAGILQSVAKKPTVSNPEE